MFTLHFNERVWAGLPAGQAFTSERQELREALLRSTARGQTALFDAVRAGLAHLERARWQKKVLIVLSDGGDNASRARLEDVLAAALRMDAVIYTVNIHDPYDRDGDPMVLRTLASTTGGAAFFVRRAGEARATLDRIAREIRSGCTAGTVIGRIDVPRLGLSVITRAGDDAKTLKRGVGHLSDTPMPGEGGHAAFAGHRDTHFRQLRNIRHGDRIVVATSDGRYEYTVRETRVVPPTEISVLDPTDEPTLTLVTYHPFNFIGPAPNRFIVRATASDAAD